VPESNPNSRRQVLLDRLTKLMAAHQRRWAILLQRKQRVLKVERWK
jgi:hypothetical protein